MVGEGLQNMCDNGFQIFAIWLKHKGSPWAESHRIHTHVFLNTHLVYYSGELGHLVSEEKKFRYDSFNFVPPYQFYEMEGHGNLQRRPEAQPTLEAEIRENLWRPERSRIYHPISTGFGAPAAVIVVAGMSTGIGRTIGRPLSPKAGAPMGGSPALQCILQRCIAWSGKSFTTTFC
jgi:hypothetical protein